VVPRPAHGGEFANFIVRLRVYIWKWVKWIH